MRITGLDLSLAKTGVATLTDREGGWDLRTLRVTTPPHSKGDTRALRDRMDYVRAVCSNHAEAADLVVLEGPSFASVGSSSKDLVGLWWLVYDRLCRDDLPTLIVPPSTLKKWASGKGNASKGQVAVGVFRTFPFETFGVDFAAADDNEVDAAALAGIGAQVLGLSVPIDLPKYRADVVAGLRVPSREAA